MTPTPCAALLFAPQIRPASCAQPSALETTETGCWKPEISQAQTPLAEAWTCTPVTRSPPTSLYLTFRGFHASARVSTSIPNFIRKILMIAGANQ